MSPEYAYLGEVSKFRILLPIYLRDVSFLESCLNIQIIFCLFWFHSAKLMNTVSHLKLINKDLDILFRLKQLYISLQKYYVMIIFRSHLLFLFPCLYYSVVAFKQGILLDSYWVAKKQIPKVIKIHVCFGWRLQRLTGSLTQGCSQEMWRQRKKDSESVLCKKGVVKPLSLLSLNGKAV